MGKFTKIIRFVGNCNLMAIYDITQQIDNQLGKFMFVIIDVIIYYRTLSWFYVTFRENRLKPVSLASSEIAAVP
jgi:hypothetical protein